MEIQGNSVLELYLACSYPDTVGHDLHQCGKCKHLSVNHPQHAAGISEIHGNSLFNSTILRLVDYLDLEDCIGKMDVLILHEV